MIVVNLVVKEGKWLEGCKYMIFFWLFICKGKVDGFI